MAPTKLEAALEIAYAIEGVVGARAWEADGLVAVGIRVAPGASAAGVLGRVEAALRGLREPGERWELGLIGEDELLEG